MYNNKNPFAKEDLFIEIVKLDDSVNKSMRQSLNNYISKNYNSQNTIMRQLQKVLTFFTTHTLTAVFTATICLGTIGTFAAQNVAPEQYKPSTVINNLFKNNKIQQNNSNIPLVSDGVNDVVSSDKCGISIKYPKQVESEKIIATYNSYDSMNNLKITSQMESKSNGIILFSDNYLNSININCSKAPIPVLDNNLNQKLSNKEFSELTGWFILAEQNLQDITTESQQTAGPMRNVYFTYKDTYYAISFMTQNIPQSILSSQTDEVKKAWENVINKQGVFGNQIQIQFNDVAQNIPNAEILKFDNVATGGYLFEYDKVLKLESRTLFDINGPEKLEFSDPSKKNTFYVINNKELQKKIKDLNIEVGDSIQFTGQVKNSDSTINISKREEYTITNIDKISKESGINTVLDSSKIGEYIKINEKIKFLDSKGYEGGVFFDFERSDKSIIRINSYLISSQNIKPTQGKTYNFNGEILKDEWFNNPEGQKIYNENYNYPLNQIVWSTNFEKSFYIDGIEIKNGQIPKVQTLNDVEVNYFSRGEDNKVLIKIDSNESYFVNDELVYKLAIAKNQPETNQYIFSGEVIDNGNGTYQVAKINKFVLSPNNPKTQSKINYLEPKKVSTIELPLNFINAITADVYVRNDDCSKKDGLINAEVKIIQPQQVIICENLEMTKINYNGKSGYVASILLSEKVNVTIYTIKKDFNKIENAGGLFTVYDTDNNKYTIIFEWDDSNPNSQSTSIALAQDYYDNFKKELVTMDVVIKEYSNNPGQYTITKIKDFNLKNN